MKGCDEMNKPRSIVVYPCTREIGGTKTLCKVTITYSNGVLSFCGDIGSWISGQCVDEIRQGEPRGKWTRDMLNKLCNTWERWHLNDMRPYCAHQRLLKWDKLASKKVILYHYRLSPAALQKQKAAEKAASTALKEGKTFIPTEEQVKYARLKYSITTPSELSGEAADLYVPYKSLYNGDHGSTEERTLGYLKPDEHPDGLLTKPCPVCGYKYGSAWLKEEVPEKVIDWLFSLPS